MTDEAKQLADKIAADLCTDGDGRPADRLALVCNETEDAPTRKLSGWGPGPLAVRIARHIEPTIAEVEKLRQATAKLCEALRAIESLPASGSMPMAKRFAREAMARIDAQPKEATND